MRPFDYVDPMINTAKPKPRWVFFQSASRPFGMVQLSPDTDTDGTWGVGYRYKSPKIKCFSHIHSWQLSGIPILPYCGEYTEDIKGGYSYSHETEDVKPGYHKVELRECNITAELTASKRVGMHKYSLDSGESGGILIDLGKSLGPGDMAGIEINQVSSTRIIGYVINAPTVRRHKPCTIYFCIDSNMKISKLNIREDNSIIVKFGNSENTIMIKTAISYVNTKQAILNMEKEINHWDFERVIFEAEEEWSGILDRIQVKGGTHEQKVKFYTDLWRTTFGGHIISDVDGHWCDTTGQEPIIRRVPVNADGTPEYDFISNADIFWGAHWSHSLVWDLVFPDIKSAYCKSLVEMYKYGGLIPRGPSGGNYTFVMIAAHSGAFITSAYMKGIRDFDIEKAYEGIKRNAFPGGLMGRAGYESMSALDGGIEEFIERGYVPERERKSKGFHCDGAAQTLEYSYDHWCIAQLANVLGYKEDYDYFIEKSENYKNIYDSESGFMRPRNTDGSFIEVFDPLSKEGFCEGNSWGYTYYVPHDIPGLIKLMGGEKEFINKLNSAFEKAGEMNYYAAKPELRRDKAYINYGNENTRFHASLFSHAGAPELTQKWSRTVKSSLFSNTGKLGFCEDDDCGLSAGTSLLLALGLFDIKGGAYEDPVYELGSPIFDEVIIKLNNQYYSGKEFKITTNNNSSKNIYVKHTTLNNKSLSDFTIRHEDVINGGNVVIDMSNKPFKNNSSV
ncbi:MAG: GH92 family glycosyl hydrolase [Clostridiales bacterium]|nr:GH92 family glycosyl hydrolase [Clostridiales bacterium]